MGFRCRYRRAASAPIIVTACITPTKPSATTAGLDFGLGIPSGGTASGHAIKEREIFDRVQHTMPDSLGIRHHLRVVDLG